MFSEGLTLEWGFVGKTFLSRNKLESGCSPVNGSHLGGNYFVLKDPESQTSLWLGGFCCIFHLSGSWHRKVLQSQCLAKIVPEENGLGLKEGHSASEWLFWKKRSVAEVEIPVSWSG